MLKEKRSFLDKFTNARDEEQAITQPRSMPVYSEDEETQMTVDHSEEVMQEQQNVIESLKKRIEALEADK